MLSETESELVGRLLETKARELMKMPVNGETAHVALTVLAGAVTAG